MNKRINPSVLLEQFTADHALRCAFSRSKSMKIGTGSTTQRQHSKEFFYIEQKDKNRFECRRINENFLPTGEKETLTKDQVISEFVPEMELYTTKVRPAMGSLASTLGRADRYRRNGKTFSAEMEYNNALALDKNCVRALFGLGLVYLARSEQEKADTVFQNLVRLPGAYEVEHKHLFNEFGIALRKSGMFQQAVSYYSRALECSPEDEHISFNLARAWFENREIPACIRFLARSLQLRHDFAEALAFCRFLLVLARDRSIQKKHGVRSLEGIFGNDAGFVTHCLERIVDSSAGERQTGIDQLLGFLPDG